MPTEFCLRICQRTEEDLRQPCTTWSHNVSDDPTLFGIRSDRNQVNCLEMSFVKDTVQHSHTDTHSHTRATNILKILEKYCCFRYQHEMYAKRTLSDIKSQQNSASKDILPVVSLEGLHFLLQLIIFLMTRF